MADMDSAIRGIAQVLATGSPEGEPDQPHIPVPVKGTVIGAPNGTTVTVRFPGPNSTNLDYNLRYLLTGRTLTIGDKVFCLQLEHQRVVLAAISG